MSEVVDLKNISKFNGQNFQAWKFQMKAILIANDILGIVDGTEPKPEQTDQAAIKSWVRRDAKAMFILSSSMESAQLEYLITCESSKDMWSKLSSIHEQRSESN